MKTLYFDHCASTPPYEQVLKTVGELMALHYANAGALHRAGTEAARLVERARASAAERLGAKPEEVVFTSGGTESNNLAIKGVYFASSLQGTKHIITTPVEHASVFETIKQLGRWGAEVTVLPVDSLGRVSAADVEAALRPETVLVSVMHVGNETGVIQPIEEIGKVLQGRPRTKFHVDGVQAVGKVPFRWSGSGVDFYTASAHKFRGPKGVGLALVREGTSLEPLLAGGGQEGGTRSGTSNVPGIVGTVQALRLATESLESRTGTMRRLRLDLLDRLRSIPELVLNVPEDAENVAPHVINISYPGMRPEVIVHMLEEQGVLVSTQSACSSKSLKPSRVLSAMGLDEARASGSIRISLGDEHTEEDIRLLAERLAETVARLKPLERK
ncbi:cysteine desulfurase family protein [Cohnella zeiphila]|uniref:Cysteine desulfurase n=1 Tax=Cohnella zeiphila TaxID=2761120 RepID=A0A7X0VTT4_9BACL|nr:cysteine desulfurase family protein [Cohnella zeiphila]MBB6729685.1 cysteine desulfurase [Cohnella zeiphila]